MEELKPCPRCGNPKRQVDLYGYKVNWVVCYKCGYHGPEPVKDNETEAIRCDPDQQSS